MKVVFSIKKVVQIVLSPVLVVVQYCKYRYCYCIVKYSIKKNISSGGSGMRRCFAQEHQYRARKISLGERDEEVFWSGTSVSQDKYL